MGDFSSWRSLLREHGQHFLDWLRAEEYDVSSLRAIAADASAYLRDSIDSKRAAVAFLDAIGPVHSQCNDQETYRLPFATHAYVWAHFLTRYWRAWRALTSLTEQLALPLGQDGVRLLDIGAGPAPFSYAAQDFYRSLCAYADLKGLIALARQELDAIVCEASEAWVPFFHRFSEAMERPGPFQAEHGDFLDMDLRRCRSVMRVRLLREEVYDPSIQDYMQWYATDEANEIAQASQRYRVVSMTYFLTCPQFVKDCRPSLIRLLRDLRPGSVVVVLGGFGVPYPEIYERLSAIAAEAGLRRLHSLPETMRCENPHEARATILEARTSVLSHVQELIRPRELNGWPAVTEHRDVNLQRRFGVRVFRRGRWPEAE